MKHLITRAFSQPIQFSALTSEASNTIADYKNFPDPSNLMRDINHYWIRTVFVFLSTLLAFATNAGAPSGTTVTFEDEGWSSSVPVDLNNFELTSNSVTFQFSANSNTDPGFEYRGTDLGTSFGGYYGGIIIWTGANVTQATIKTKDGSPFDFESIEFVNDFHTYSCCSYVIRTTGYSDGSPVTSASFDTSIGMSTQITVLDASGNDNFNAVDEVRITFISGSSGATDMGYHGLDNFTWNTAVSSSTAPTVTTASATSLSQSGATLGGEVTDNGGESVTERGVVYSTSSNPTTSDTKIQIGSGTGTFSQGVTGLSESTQYYVRAYAINSEGTSYGSQVTFTTLSGGRGGGPTTCAPSTGITTFDGSNINIAPYGALPKSGVVDCWELTANGSGSGSINHNGANSPSNVNMFVGEASTISIKSQDGTEFDLDSFTAQWFSFAGTYTISAYRDGSLIGSTTSTASSTYTQIDISSNSDFSNIDEFVFSGFGGSNVTVNLDKVTIGPAVSNTDTNPPTFDAAPVVNNVSTTFLNLDVSIDEAGTIYYVVVADGASAPSAAEVKAGTASGGGSTISNGNQTVSSGGFSGTFSVSGLSANTNYDIYVVAEDDEGTPNLQTSPTKEEVLTGNNNALYFDTDAKISGLDGPNPTNFTVEFKIYLDQLAPGGDWQGVYYNSSDDTGFFVDDQNRLVLYVTQSAYYRFETAFDLKTWTHVAFTYNNATNTVAGYLDGQVVSVTSQSGASSATMVLPTTNVTMGYGPGEYGDYSLFTGALDEFRLWNDVRSPSEIDTYKNTEISNIGDANLLRYYDFNQGVGGQANTSETSLSDRTGNSSGGTLANFTLSGDVSNWVAFSSLGGSATPTVTTSAATSVSATEATLNGEVTSDGGASITERGFIYALTSNDPTPMVGEVDGTTVFKQTSSGTTGAFNETVSGLSASSEYSYVAYATNSEGTTEGSVQTFTTSAAPVSLSTNPMLSFSNDTGFGDNVITDGEGGSATISDFNFEAYPISNSSGTKFTSDPVEYHDDWSGYPEIIALGNNATYYGWTFKSDNGDNFSLQSFDFFDWGNWNGATFVIEAFDNGSSKGTATFTGNTDGSYIELRESGVLTSIFSNIDEFRIYEQGGGDSYIGFNNIQVGEVIASIENPYVALYWPNYEANKIEGINVDGTTRSTVVSSTSDTPNYGALAIQIDGANEKVYWFDDAEESIKRANLDGSGTETFVADPGYASTMYLDENGAKLYWPNYEANSIEKMNLDGTGRETIVSSTSTTTGYGALAITVDTKNDKIYWFSDDVESIKRASLDGTGTEVFISDPGYATTLYLDSENGKLYWPNYEAQTIEVINVDGSGRETVISSTSSTANYGALAITIDVNNSKVYWFDDKAESIKRANLDGTSVETFIADPGYATTMDIPTDYVPPLNATPAISISGTNLAYTEGSTATQIDASATISDADGDADWDGGTLEIQITTNGEDADQISISDTDGDGTAITVSGTNILSNGTDIGDLSASEGIVTNGTKLTITFDADATNSFVQEVLQSIRYNNTSDDPGASNRTITFTATDVNAASSSDTRIISFTPVNNEPTLTATVSNPTFTEGGAAASLFTSTDINTVESGQNITGLSFTITNVTNGSNERINVDGTTIVLTHGTNGTSAGNSLNYSVMVIGTTATVTMTGGNLSVAAAETMYDNMSYQNNSNSPSTSNRVVTLTSIQDSGGTANGGDNTGSLSVASTVTIVENNDEPTLTATGSNPTFTEGGAAGSLFSGTSISTVESGQTIKGFIFTVSNVTDGINEVANVDGTAITLPHGTSGTTATNSLSYSVTVVGTTATLALTGGTMSTSATQTLVDNISYQNNSNTPSTSNRVVTLTSIQDSGGTANGGDDTASISVASTVTVVGVNDEPTLTATASNPTFTEGGAAASLFTSTDINTVESGQNITGLSFTITNVTNGSNERINIDGTTIVLTHGTNGSTAGNSLNYSVMVIGTTATVTMTGDNLSVAAAETMYDNMSYQNNSNSPSTSNRVVTLTSIQDSGGTANGGDNTGSLSVASTVTIVENNDEPTLTATGSNPTFTEGGAAGSLFSGTSISTVESGQTIKGFTFIISNVADGINEVVNVDGTAIVLTHGTSGSTAGNSLSYSVTVIGTTATVALTGGTISTATTQTLIDNVSYQNNSNAPSTSNRVVTLTSIQDSGGTANGGDDTASISVASTVTVVGVNDEPTLTATGIDPTFTEDGDEVDVFESVTASTVEDGQTIQSFSITISNVNDGIEERVYVDGSVVLLLLGALGTTSNNSLFFTVSYAGSTATISFSGGDLSSNDFQTLIDELKYENTSDNPTVGTRSITLAGAQDNGGTANGGDDSAMFSISSVVTIKAVDDAAIVTGTKTGDVNEGNVGDAITASGTLSITDVDDTDPTFNDVASTNGDNGYGSFEMNGQTWTYTLDPSTVQGLDAGDFATDRFTFTATDGTEQIITISISGTNDASIVSGTFSGNVDEKNEGDESIITGSISISDIDENDSPQFSDQTSTVGDNSYGSFELTNGVWEYILDQSSVQDLDEGDEVNDYITYTATDGTAQQIEVTIYGSNDESVFGGDISGTVTEGDIGEPETAGGTLTFSDLDADDSPTVADFTSRNGDNGFGSFDLTSLSWVYTLDQDAVQDLDEGDVVTDKTTITGTDGNMQVITITINGTDDASVISGTFSGSETEGWPEDVLTINGVINISDVDADDNPAFSNVNVAGANGYGTFDLSGGNWTYTVDFDAIVHLDNAESVLDNITFVATDGTTQQIIVTINGKDPDNDRDNISDYVDTDDDNDGTEDTDDAFPLDPSEDTDTDEDGIGDNADTDDDNDGTEDSLDAFPLDPAEDTDTDEDGTGNNADTDDDNDGTADEDDAFPLDPSEDTDTDEDGTGDNADTDDDNDGTEDSLDAFPLDPAEDTDTDEDGTGNNADTDDDNDGTADEEDAFPLDPSEDTDTDEDGTGDNADTDDDNDGTEDSLDAFPLDPSEDRDTDDDGTGNKADTDDDNDGTADEDDAFPLDPSEDTDTDGDGIGNNADTDDDNDGTLDVNDPFPLDPSEDRDTDDDGTGNNADADDDNDGTNDEDDAFPLDPSEDTDTDGDGIGNNADTDDDNDGTLDVNDAFPLDPSEDTDTDNDGIGNNEDTNDDNDIFDDVDDEFPLIPNGTSDMDGDGISDSDEGLADNDQDGIPNYLDDDSDDDGTSDFDEGIEDCDNDGIPDYLDPYSCQDLMTRKILTANNDGFNDQFVIEGIDKFPNNQVIIYNRWGAVVWEMKGYDNEDPEKNFSGISNKLNSSNALPGGTYFYVIIRGGEKPQKGFFVLN